uniref:Uncharacterized protein n=1 Tax=Ignisphaera aggregans TaxID=334771 RepID=A0A7C4BCP5_9CREN
MLKARAFNGCIFCTALSGLVAVVVILALSVAIGVVVYINVSRVFEASKPPISNAVIRVVCYNLSNSYLCLASNPLEYKVSVKLYLYNGSGQGAWAREESLEPLSAKPLFCDKENQMCQSVPMKIVCGEAVLSGNGDQMLRVIVVYR